MLASRSPRRLALVRDAGVDVTTCPAPCDESPRPGEHPLDYVRRVAQEKLAAARRLAPTAPPGADWLAADTIVWSPETGALFGKPRDRNEARRTLEHLTATPHAVSTGWVLDGPAGLEAHVETTQVAMRPLHAGELEQYLAGDEWHDKAGGYGIQGIAGAWVTRIEGSYTNVVGLPLAQVLVRLHARSAA